MSNPTKRLNPAAYGERRRDRPRFKGNAAKVHQLRQPSPIANRSEIPFQPIEYLPTDHRVGAIRSYPRKCVNCTASDREIQATFWVDIVRGAYLRFHPSKAGYIDCVLVPYRSILSHISSGTRRQGLHILFLPLASPRPLVASFGNNSQCELAILLAPRSS